MRHLLPIVPAFVIAVSCIKVSPDGEAVSPDVKCGQSPRGDLVSYELKGSLTVSDIRELNEEIDPSFLKYDLSYYRIVYKTLFKDKLINASGLVLVPDKVDSTHLMAFFHGTSIPVAPVVIDMSDYTGRGQSYQINSFALPFASNGYFLVLPDYVGYGESSRCEHPYTYYPELDKGNIDAMAAAGHLLEKLGLRRSDHIFLTGWSQGGGACLAAQKEIEEQFSGSLRVTSSALAGPYDFSAFLRRLVDNPSEMFPAMSLYAWAAYTMNHFSPVLGLPDDQIFRRPMYDTVSTVSAFGSTPDDVFTGLIMYSMKGNDPMVTQALEDNTYSSGWTPAGEVFLYHVRDDEMVPYFNFESAMAGLKGSVKGTTYESGGHFSHFNDYVEATLKEFEVLR